MKKTSFKVLILSRTIFWLITILIFLGLCVVIFKVGGALGMHQTLLDIIVSVIFVWILLSSTVTHFNKEEALHDMIRDLTLVETELEKVERSITPTSSYSEGYRDGITGALDYIKEIKGEKQ